MYFSFYGLSEAPFNLTPDSRFFFLSSRHREAFAALLAKLRDGGTEGVAFLIGGADGLPAGARTEKAISLGPMTLPHGLARIVLAEQIYRAATILAGHPYHRA